MPLPPPVLRALESIEPDTNFSSPRGPRVTSSLGSVYYVKYGSLSNAEQWAGEVESLKAIDVAAPGICPRVLYFGAWSDLTCMISNYVDLGPLLKTSASALAQRMALELHDPEKSEPEAKGRFGFEIPTYCGVTRLENGWFSTWDEAYSSMINQLLDGLEKKGKSYGEACNLGRQVVAEAIPYLLGPSRLQDIHPVILHGDLWSGNVGSLPSGNPIIYDPASYYGHNEADLSIARIFGGFPPSFYTEYHRHRPKSEPADEYDERSALYELFHYLNHSLIFGNSYLGPSVLRMKRILQFVKART